MTANIGLALAIFAVWLLVHMQDEIATFFQKMGSIGPQDPTEDKVWGLIAFSLVAITLGGIIRILTRGQR